MTFLLFLPISLLFFIKNGKQMIACTIIYFLISAALLVKQKRSSTQNFTFKPKLRILPTIISTSLCAYMSIRFYVEWLTSVSMRAIADSIGIKPNLFLLAITFVLFAGSVYASLIIADFYYRNNSDDNKLITKWFNRTYSFDTKPIVFVTLLTVIFWLSQSGLHLWGNTDNFWISNTFNGTYSDDNFCCFFNPMLASLVSAIGTIFPTADGFVLLSEFFGLVGVWCFLYVLSRCVPRKKVLAVFLFAVFLNVSLNLLHLPFTAYTGALMFFGFVILYGVINKKVGKPFIPVGIIMMCFALLWRLSAVYLTIPFMLLAFIVDIILKKGEERKSYIKKLVILAVPIIIFGVATNAYADHVRNSDYYKDGIEYNGARAGLVDFPQKHWSEVSDQLEPLGVSQNDYESLIGMIDADTDVVTTDLMKEVAAVSGITTYQKMMLFVQQYITDLINTICSYSHMYRQLILAAVLILLALFTKEHWLKKAALFASLIGAFIIGIYFAYFGHMPWYLVQVLMFGIWMVFFAVFSSNPVREKKTENTRQIIACAIAILLLANSGICFKYNPASLFSNESDIKTLTDIDEEAFVDENPDTIYIWGVYDFDSVIRSSRFFSEGKLLTREFAEHNIVDGEWQYSQPYYVELLNRIGAPNPMRALLERDHTYYVGNYSRCEKVLIFIQEHYNSNAAIERLGTVDDISVWRFYIDDDPEKDAEYEGDADGMYGEEKDGMTDGDGSDEAVNESEYYDEGYEEVEKNYAVSEDEIVY